MKINECPVCHRKAFRKFNQIFVEQACITCENCGAQVNHSIPYLVAPNIITLVALSFSLEYLREMKAQWVYFCLAILVLLWLSSILFLTPLKEINSKLKPNPPQKSEGGRALKWYCSPVIWLGIPIALAIFYGLFI